jgi:hypothetical protein
MDELLQDALDSIDRVLQDIRDKTSREYSELDDIRVLLAKYIYK